MGKTNFKFLIVGEGDEREYLEKTMKTAEFTGFIAGEQLAEAYANMDIFVFPSETDAFGNVAQEANCSGVPAIVSNLGKILNIFCACSSFPTLTVVSSTQIKLVSEGV